MKTTLKILPVFLALFVSACGNEKPDTQTTPETTTSTTTHATVSPEVSPNTSQDSTPKVDNTAATDATDNEPARVAKAFLEHLSQGDSDAVLMMSRISPVSETLDKALYEQNLARAKVRVEYLVRQGQELASSNGEITQIVVDSSEIDDSAGTAVVKLTVHRNTDHPRFKATQETLKLVRSDMGWQVEIH